MCIVLSKHSSDHYVLLCHDLLSRLAVDAFKDRSCKHERRGVTRDRDIRTYSDPNHVLTKQYTSL